MDKMVGLHFGLVLGLASIGLADTGWELVKQKGDRKIYLRVNRGEEVKELMAVERFDATPEELAGIYMDGENHANWYPGCETSRVVEKFSDSSFYFYNKIRNPWPVKDRDYVIEVNLRHEGKKGGVLIEYKEVEGVVPEDKSCIRVKKFRGFWRFTPESNGKTVVTYVLKFDPAGDTPAGFISWSMPRFGGNIFTALFERVKTLRATSRK